MAVRAHLSWYQVILASAILMLSSPWAACSAAYRFEQVDLPGAVASSLNAINASGVAVGTATLNDTTFATAGFTYAAGHLSPFAGPPGAVSVDLVGITDAGALVGNFSTTFVDDGNGNQVVGPSQIFVKTASGFQVLNAPALLNVYAAGISPNGRWLVGVETDPASGASTNIVYDTTADQLVTLTRGGAGTITSVLGADDQGRVFGHDRTPLPTGGFGGPGWIYDRTTGTYQDVSFPGAERTSLRYLGLSGDMAGYFGDARFSSIHGFFSSGGNLVTVDVPGAIVTRILGGNSAGTLVGDFWTDPSLAGLTSGFVATPVPEPASTWLMFGGLFALAILRWRERSLGNC